MRSRIAYSASQVTGDSGIEPSLRQRFEQVLRPYLHLIPSWCRTIAIEFMDSVVGSCDAACVSAHCNSVRGEITFRLPPNWAHLPTEDQELSLVFWLVLDDLARGLASSAALVVDAVRSESEQTTVPCASDPDLYEQVLPLLGRGALRLATETVEMRSAGAASVDEPVP
jgi:hypothetical protein